MIYKILDVDLGRLDRRHNLNGSGGRDNPYRTDDLDESDWFEDLDELDDSMNWTIQANQTGLTT